MIQTLIPFNHDHALIRQHSQNRLLENTLDYNIRNNMRRKTKVIPFQSSVRFPIKNQFLKYSPNAYCERTNDSSQVINLRAQNENNRMNYVNGEYDSANGRRYAVPQNTKQFYSRNNNSPSIITDTKVFAAHNRIPLPDNHNYSSVRNVNSYSNNNNNNKLNNSCGCSHNNVHNNDTNVNNPPQILSYSTKNINNKGIYYRNNTLNSKNILSRSQSLPELPEYRCRDNISSHNNIVNMRRPPQYYKNSIIYHKYTPFRGDYENSRYGDYTYNYYLNSPMRGDVSEDWKFPPQYYYMPKFNSSTYTYDNKY